MTAIRCPRGFCGHAMETTTDGMGRVVFSCPACARNKRGLCRECPKSLTDPRQLRCPTCSRKRHLAQCRVRDRERYAARRNDVLRHHRERNARPEIREWRRRYMAAYRQAHPRDANDRAYGRAWNAARRADPAYRARENARKRKQRRLARERASLNQERAA